MVTRCLKNYKSCHICSMRLKRLSVEYEKYGTLFIYDAFGLSPFESQVVVVVAKAEGGADLTKL